MCGILGSLNIPFDFETLAVLEHRGPDDAGIKSLVTGEDTVTLGHRRLSIVDLSPSGHQPMLSHCGNYIIIFNGEIYNHNELRKKLDDHKFIGHSDTETIVNYIAKFGIYSVKDFNGIFAFILFDKKGNNLYAARDRYGVKPLYYWQYSDKIIFSSEIKAIRKITDQLSLSAQNLALFLRLRYCPSPSTLYNEIFKIRPGHIMKVNIETKKISHANFIEPVSINDTITFNDALEQYGFLFENAVKRQLMSDVEIGMQLSGGIDSALVTKFIVKNYSQKVKTFTVGFNEKSDANEFDEARQTAKAIGTDHHEVVINNDQFEGSFSKMMQVIEEPLGTTSTIPLFFLNEKMHKHNLKVILTGQGADEPWGGYDRYKGELLYSSILRPFAESVRMVSGEMGIRNEKIRRVVSALSEKDVINRFDKTYALFSKKEILELIGVTSTKSNEAINYYYQLLKGNQKHPVEAMMSNDMRMNLSDDLLLLSDKISMHFSIESRVPFLDNDLMDFCESLPYKYRLSLTNSKILHKKFAEKHFPREMVYRRKKGFKTPTEKWFKEKIGKTYNELLFSDKNSCFSIYFDLKEVKKVFDLHINKGINLEKQIFSLISLYYWMENFFSD